jgi:hypothetical protein
VALSGSSSGSESSMRAFQEGKRSQFKLFRLLWASPAADSSKSRSFPPS